jgi:recombination protein RecA
MPLVERDDRQEREKIKAVDIAVGQIEKQFGKGSIMRLGQKGAIQPIDFIPTGAISIDSRCVGGAGGRGRSGLVVGKTTLALQVIGEAETGNGGETGCRARARRRLTRRNPA